MRELMLARLQEQFNEEGALSGVGGDADINCFGDIEAMSDPDLLLFFEWTVGFQG